MKTFLSLSLLSALAVTIFAGCATSDESATDPVSYPDPSPLDTQARLQEMHSEVLRREF